MPNRLTWIAPDGTVRYDNQSNAASMENHLGREEIAQASETGTGFSRRFSQTLLEEQLYCAKKLDDGSYLRVAATQSSLAGSLWRMGGALVAGIAVVLIAAAVLSPPVDAVAGEAHQRNQPGKSVAKPCLRRADAHAAPHGGAKPALGNADAGNQRAARGTGNDHRPYERGDCSFWMRIATCF